MTSTEPNFLDMVSPATRKVLVSERLAAMRGRMEEVCNRLKEHIKATPPEKNSDIVALGLLLSELLHIDGQNEDSIAAFREFVEPYRDSLPTPVQLVVTENLSILQIEGSPREGVSTFYHLVDRRRLAQCEGTEVAILLTAQSAIEKDKYSEALPLLWQNFLRAHGSGSWRASQWAAERLANLYLKVGALEQACHYLIMADAEKEVEQLAVVVSFRKDPDLIRTILRWLMDFANLRRHFIVACKFLVKVPDLIPDADIDVLAEWLLSRCREPAAVNGGGVMRAGWEAMRELGNRVSQKMSQRIIESALSHPEWQAPLPGGNKVLPNRVVLVEAVTFLVHSAPTDYLPVVAEAALPLATERVQNHDYPDVVNLLCNLSQLGGDAIRTKMKTALYIPDRPINRVLAQVAEVFGVEALTPSQWDEFANKIIEETRLTVQRLKPGEVPKPVAEKLMAMNQETSTGQIHVTVQTGVGLQAIAKGKQHLSDATIERLIHMLVEMATNPDNLLSNREFLLAQLCGFADRVPSGLSDEVVATLESLTRGEIPESKEYPSSTAVQDPMSSTRMNMGTPEQVQAVALVAVASFCGADTARTRQIEEALFEGFVSSNATVRRGAYAAARHLPNLSSEQLLPMLMGLRDPDPTAAVTAFAAFAIREEWSLTRPLWKLFILAVRLASQSQDVKLRRHAAFALRKRIDAAPTKQIRADAEAILELLSSDAAYSVREAALNTL